MAQEREPQQDTQPCRTPSPAGPALSLTVGHLGSDWALGLCFSSWRRFLESRHLPERAAPLPGVFLEPEGLSSPGRRDLTPTPPPDQQNNSRTGTENHFLWENTSQTIKGNLRPCGPCGFAPLGLALTSFVSQQSLLWGDTHTIPALAASPSSHTIVTTPCTTSASQGHQNPRIPGIKLVLICLNKSEIIFTHPQ